MAHIRTKTKIVFIVSGITLAIASILMYKQYTPASPDFLFVLQADGASITSIGDRDKIILDGVNNKVTSFADRPYRIAGTILMEDLIEILGEGKNSFEEDSPNASITFENNGEQSVAVVVLENPKYNSAQGTLEYEYQLLEGELAEKMENISVLIDSVRRLNQGRLVYRIKNDTRKTIFVGEAPWPGSDITTSGTYKIKPGKELVLYTTLGCYNLYAFHLRPTQGGDSIAKLSECIGPKRSPMRLEFKFNKKFETYEFKQLSK
jgi:hypothetical protein